MSGARRDGHKLHGLRLCALLGLVVVLLTGCRTDAIVRISVKPDGSGTIAVDVYLDEEAAAQLGDLSAIVAVDDLKAAGWTIIGPASRRTVMKELGEAGASVIPEGDVQMHLEHPFADLDEANAILATLSGPDGPYKNVRISRESTLFATKLRVTGSVDLSKGLDTFGDAALTRALGAPLSEVVARAGGSAPEGNDLVVELQVNAQPNQSWQGDKGNAGMTPELVAAATPLGGPAQTIDVASTQSHVVKVVLIAVGGLVVLLLIWFVVSTRRRWPRSVGRHERR